MVAQSMAFQFGCYWCLRFKIVAIIGFAGPPFSFAPYHSNKKLVTMTKTGQHQDFQRQHKRSPSVTRTHQRKSSITSASTTLHRIPDKTTQASTLLASLSNLNMSRSWHKYTSRLSMQLDAFLNPSGPILPYEQQGTSKSWVTMLTRSRLARLLLLLYAMFSVMLSFSQLWGWYSSSTAQLDPRFGVGWQPVRTYDSGNMQHIFIRHSAVIDMFYLSRSILFSDG